MQSSTTYSFNILAYNEKGESDYTTDIVQKATEAAPAPDGKSPPEDPPAGGGEPDQPRSYSEILAIIAAIGGGLLVCNLLLLYCYTQRKRGSDMFGTTESTMSRSSILEMYFSASEGSDRTVSDSQSVGSDVDTRLEDEEEEEVSSGARVDMWRGAAPLYRPPPPHSRYSPYTQYTPSPPPWPQDNRRYLRY